MCINISPDYPAQPDGSIRFKLMCLRPDGSVQSTNHPTTIAGRAGNGYIGQCHRDQNMSHKVGDVMTADTKPGDFDYMAGYQGIHVTADEKAFNVVARAYWQNNWGPLARVKVSCRGFYVGGRPDFLSRGTGYNETGEETWNEVTILEITELKECPPEPVIVVDVPPTFTNPTVT